jgi:Ca2+-binding RTX toxin-like protein
MVPPPEIRGVRRSAYYVVVWLTGVGTGANSLLDQTKEGKMRRVTLMLAAMAMIVSLFAVAAYAAEIWGTAQNDDIYETNQDDNIFGRQGNDYVTAAKYEGDTDKVEGNRDNDTISVEDGDNKDRVDGGQDFDVCVGDPNDVIINCEMVNGFPVR